MNREKKEQAANNPMKIFGALLPYLPVLLVRFSGVFLRFRRQAKKSGRIFQRELRHQGIDKETAAALTEVYLEGSHLLKYIQRMT